MDEIKLFDRYYCVDCRVNVYRCTVCSQYFFTRVNHLCDSLERELILSEIFPRDEGVVEGCNVLYRECDCRRPCTHFRLKPYVLR